VEVLLNCLNSLKEYVSTMNLGRNSNQHPYNNVSSNTNYQLDEEFVTNINSLSAFIKEYFKACRASVGVMKSSSDNVNLINVNKSR